MGKLDDVPDKIDFPQEEDKVLQFWKEKDVFRTSLELAKGRDHYTFYDGPPFATGLPHYGHILAGTIKDVVTRWAAQNGYYVERRFGWDTHGLPVEYEIDQKLGIKGPADVLKMGIENYNKECRTIVMRYSTEWQTTVERMGRWIDFENDYKTLYPWFMESVWWVFSELFKKNLVYRGVKVMPFSTGCSTPLSNFEANQNYKDVVDPSVFIAFPMVDNPSRCFVAWTTTPWTLPSNLALCVHPELKYAIVKDNRKDSSGKELIMLECRLNALFKSEKDYEVLELVEGSTFKDVAYIPPFNFFASKREELSAFRVLNDTFVKTDSGTGVVHQAPYFGEIDYDICLKSGIIRKDTKIICPIDEKGRFTDEVADFAGQYVKDADKNIIKKLKEAGLVMKAEQCKHSYPFCWRSDTPLIYRAVPSWFIRVEELVERLLANNDKTYWVPENVREGRFRNWLKDARDWAVSRNRFWGTPINLWASEDCEEVICVGSLEELEKFTGVKVDDLHRESIDHLEIPSPTDKGMLKRVPEVFDCWFESGSMPYAQNHYPFENKQHFEENFPADFIAEGVDQTRGWFYTLLVLSTALFDRPPFKNLICNGLVMAADGEKMSKRKKNYPDPMEVVHKYGADALRLYLINSPVVRAENLNFREEGVRDVLKDVMLPWYNAYRYFVQNVHIYEHQTGKSFALNNGSDNDMDHWILSFTNTLVEFVREEMDKYHLYSVVSPLTKFFDTLTNSYIRLNRQRFKSDTDDRLHALTTLGKVLVIVVRLMAPFTPFFCEYLWKNLRHVVDAEEESVHYMALPTADTKSIDKSIERRVKAMSSVIDLIRVWRDRKGLGVKYPVKEVVVINRDQQFLDDVVSLEQYILSECNVKKLTVSQDKEKYGVELKAEPNFRVLGARLKGDQKKVGIYLKNEVTQEELRKLLEEGLVLIHGHEITKEEVAVTYKCDPSKIDLGGNFDVNSDDKTVIVVDTEEDESLAQEGLTREITNRIQRLRKSAKLVATQAATVYCEADEGTALSTVLNKFQETIANATGTPVVLGRVPAELSALIESDCEVKKEVLKLALVMPN
ncbi:hypothetical protein QR680_009868 [Steinernema hermaphroditum]|uniref:Isoleucine--tRNA ligase, cytoplasmic n=1 Tax=Steinernema hermaphroditum TaxID=289476 RepID=A0AA39IPB9_9BILA|nr:hypothetical protein QR680_009868 [Steinernema hermaphroditum]